MPGRKYAASGLYKYGFNGHENDNDVKGEGNQQDYGFRIYDPRIGKFLSVDPLTKSYPWLTPYQFASNTPIAAIDLDGLEGFVATGMPMGNSGYGHGMIVSPKMAGKINHEHPNVARSILFVGAVAVDVLLTKGWATRTLLASQILGAVEHNRATTPEARAAQDQRRNEALADAFITWGTGKLLGVSFNLSSKMIGIMKNRLTFVRNFEGFRKDYAAYVDLREKVFTRTYKKGDVLYQYQTKDGQLGNFFVESTATKPEQVGLLSEDYTRLFKIELKEKVEVLVTKHEKGMEYWKDFDKSVKRTTEGGGEQLFTTGINSTNATISEVKIP